MAQKIKIDVGVYTSLDVDLSQFDFTGIKEVILTIKNKANVNEEPIVERHFNTRAIHNVVITPEESLKLKASAVYDFIETAYDNKKFKITENGEVILRYGVGEQ